MCARMSMQQIHEEDVLMIDSGLCVNCIHQKTCAFTKMENKIFCEEYNYDELKVLS
jgi:hypothetical protein